MVFAVEEEGGEDGGREEEIGDHIHKYIISLLLQVLSQFPKTLVSDSGM